MLDVEGLGHWVTPARENGAVEEWSRMGLERERTSPGEPELQAQCSATYSCEVEGSHTSNRSILLTHIPFTRASSCSIPMAQSLWDMGTFLCAAAQGKPCLHLGQTGYFCLFGLVFVCLGFGLGFIFLSLHSMQALAFKFVASAPAYSVGNLCQWAVHRL